jgi:ATP-dependent Clp protease ATP-binding subunit ClpA
MNILLQILDDGHITDAQGRTVNFENTIIIMTTNAGSNTRVGSVGFGGTVSDMTRERAMKALNEFLRPEFINRVDEVVCFNQLTEENFKAIAALMLQEVKEVMEAKEIALSWDESLEQYLVKKAYSTIYGARNLRRLIQKEVEDAIANVLVERRNEKTDAIRLSSDGEKVILS